MANALPHENRRLTFEQHKWRIAVLSSTYFGYAGYYLTRKVFTIVKKPVADSMGWELSDMAHIWFAFLLAYMLGQFMTSFIGRKWGPRVILLFGLGISIAVNIVFGIANSYYTFMVFMFVNGLVQATGWPGSVGGVAEWLRPRERGTIMGVWSTSYVIGNLVVKALGGYLLGAMGWRWAFFGCTMVTFGIWWLLFLFQRNKPEDVGLEPIVERAKDGDADTRDVRASESEHVTGRQYLELALNPIVLTMGCSYFCIKFLRYALDSWLPAFLDIQGMTPAAASYASMYFDYAGLVGAIFAGLALDRIFRGNWAFLCFLMALGAVAGYIGVAYFAHSPRAVALWFGLVGFMLYGPDTLLCGAAAIELAGERNGVAVAGIVNGLGSIGPLLQEEVIGLLMRGDTATGIRNANFLTLGMSVAFALLMIGVMVRLSIVRRHHARASGA